MKTKQIPPPVPPDGNPSSGTENGEVVVKLATNHPASSVWRAITEPACLSRWFGDWLPDPHDEGSARLDFGDGDFFLIEKLTTEPPLRLDYRWRFLGTGPEDAITWRLSPLDIGCVLTVSDLQPERTAAGIQEMKEGWLDFLQRLDRYLETGETTRYAFRQELDGSIELPLPRREAWSALLEPDRQAGWLPLDGPMAQGSRLLLRDGEHPDAFRVARVTWNPPEEVRLELAAGDGAPPMEVRLALGARAGSTLLSFNHRGWEQSAVDESQTRQQRNRFSTLWIRALESARHLVERRRTEGHAPP